MATIQGQLQIEGVALLLGVYRGKQPGQCGTCSLASSIDGRLMFAMLMLATCSCINIPYSLVMVCIPILWTRLKPQFTIIRPLQLKPVLRYYCKSTKYDFTFVLSYSSTTFVLHCCHRIRTCISQDRSVDLEKSVCMWDVHTEGWPLRTNQDYQ